MCGKQRTYNPFRIRTYRKFARNSFRIRTYKNTGVGALRGTKQNPLAAARDARQEGGGKAGLGLLHSKESGALLADQLERHVHDQLPVVLRETREKLLEVLKEFRRSTGAAPLVTIGGDAFREGPNLGWRFSVVKQLVERNFESAGHLFQRLDARDGVTVLHTRDVTALQAGAFLDIPLREVFPFPDGSQAIGDDHNVRHYITVRIGSQMNSNFVPAVRI